MDKPPTIRDVARAAGVSVSVVSRVLNNSGPVANQKRDAVLRAVEDMAYRPRAAARELSGGRTLTLGLLLADLTDPFFARLADSVVWEARAHGVQVEVMTTQEDPDLEARSLEALLDRSVGGVIATPTGANVEQWQKLQEVGVNLVFVDRTIGALEGIDVVSIENAESARTATDALLALGHTRIALISGPTSASTGRSRVAGFRDALRRAGVRQQPELVKAVPFHGEGGADAVSELMARAERPTALLVANTAQVRNVVRRLAQLRIDVPGALSLIVFDDDPWVELVSPPLSVVRQPIDLLARHSVELVLSPMRGPIGAAPRTVEVEAEFVMRSSCATPIVPAEIA